MSNADDFIQLFNQADQHIRKVSNCSGKQGFSTSLTEAAKRSVIIRNHEYTLWSYAQLRNVIVHAPKYPKQIIAEPLHEVVDDFRNFVERLVEPKRLIPTFQKDVQIFAPEAPLADVLRYKRSEDYSQIVVLDRGKMAMLTDEGIGRWLEASIQENDISLGKKRVLDALVHQPDGSFRVLRAADAIDDAIEAFADALPKGTPRLYAVLVTQRGRDDEEPLGIVTPWDLFPLINGCCST